jgi:hypothetical protein
VLESAKRLSMHVRTHVSEYDEAEEEQARKIFSFR